MPDVTGSTRGSIQFTDLTTGAYRSASLGMTGAAAYSVTLYAGTYEVIYVYTSSQTALPSLNHQLGAAFALSQSGAKTTTSRPSP